MKQVIMFVLGLVIGGLCIYFIPGIIKPTEPCPKNGLSKIIIDNNKYLKFYGGEMSKDSAIKYSDEYLKYLKLKEPKPAEFDKVYTAGSYFTVEEIGNYLNDVIQKSGLPPSNITLHFCTTKYPAGLKSPVSGKLIGERLGSCIAFFDASGINRYPEMPASRATRLKFEASNFLGAYNWGDLMP
ncbi:MAG: hypothetical protein IPP48_07720 [Chitinophagaceae bacterium]|nr:hypothetical protein [Chitinophagaceae bacterium]